MNGLVLIDKPAGCTSHDVVNRWRKLARTKRVGHLGTLDPMATGLLALLTGTSTRLAQFYGRETKTYVAGITFGLQSETYDAEGIVVSTGVDAPGLESIESEVQHFRGKFLQTPPAVSAKKINGTPAYKLARKQIAVELAPVEVEVTELCVTGYQPPTLSLTVTCAAGTYIRSIAHDLGVRLGCGAVLSSLRRTAVGELRVEAASTLDHLTELARQDRLHEAVHPAVSLLPGFPAVHVDSATETQIRQGRNFRASPFVVAPGTPRVKAISEGGELIAIGELVIPNVYHPGTVL